MLSNYLSNHPAQLLAISNAQLCPFTSVGHVKMLKKRVLELCWLNAKCNNLSRAFTAPKLDLLISLIESDENPAIVSQACIEIMANLPQNINITFINNVLNEPKLTVLAKLIISKVLLQQHSFNLIRLLDVTTLFFAYTAQSEHSEQALIAINQAILVTEESSHESMLTIFDELCKNDLINSPLMSLFLLLLSADQVNKIGNHASNTLCIDDTLQVLLQSGFVKLVPLANASLLQLEQPKKIIALIKRTLGETLDLLVNFETQVQAYNDDEHALIDFQQQLKLNWPKYETQLSTQRLIAGKVLDEPLNAIQMSAMDSYSQALFNLYTYYRHVAAEKVSSGVQK